MATQAPPVPPRSHPVQVLLVIDISHQLFLFTVLMYLGSFVVCVCFFFPLNSGGKALRPHLQACHRATGSTRILKMKVNCCCSRQLCMRCYNRCNRRIFVTYAYHRLLSLCAGRASDYSARRASAPTRQRPVSHSPPYQDLSARQQSVTTAERAARPHSVAVSSGARAPPPPAAAAVAASHRSVPSGARSSSPQTASAAAVRSPSSISRALSMNSGLHARREGSNSPTLQSGGSLVDRVKVTLFGTIRAPGAAANGSSSSNLSGAAVVARAGEAATRRLSKWVVRQTVLASGLHYVALVWPSAAAAAAAGSNDSPTHEAGTYKTHAEAEQACRCVNFGQNIVV
jgi:hypothetical protein